MAVNLSPYGGVGAQFLDNSGNVLTGGKIYTYAAGTTTNQATYTNATGTVPHSNPIVLDASGRVPGGEIWLTDGLSYKFVTKDSNDVLIATYDNLSGINSNFVNYSTQEEIQTATAGQTIFTLATINYTPGTNSLSVFVDGVNQYDGVSYAYVETDSTTVTFNSGLHVGALVKFTTAVTLSSGVTDASLVTYDPPFTGSVATTVENKLSEYINVIDFGADPTGVTDSTTAIQAAIDAAFTAGQQVVAYGTFKVSSKITIKGDTDFSQAIFNVYSTPAIAFEVSTGSSANPTDIINNSVIWLPKRIENMTKPSTGWAGQGIGVRTVNAYSCQIFVGNIVNFATGLQVTSYDQNNAYNNYYLGHLENNQVNIQLVPGNAAGATNENTFIGGRCSFYSGEGTNISGTRQILINKASNSVNNNIFIRCSLEGDGPEYHLECGGATNTFQQCRWEATTPKVHYIGDNDNQGVANVILYGYGVDNIVYSYTGATVGAYNDAYGTRNKYISVGTSNGIGLTQTYSGSYPIHTYYDPGIKPETATATQWSVKHGVQYLQGKRSTDTYPRIQLEYSSGKVWFGDGASALDIYLRKYNSGQLQVSASDSFTPATDNITKLGSSSYRWTTVYATTGTINTSDATQKQQIVDLTQAEQAVAKAIKGLIKTFKFNDAVKTKGDDARIHVGVIAQDVQAAFEAEGLDPNRYGLFCSDVLEDGTVQLGIRYEELLAFVIAAL